MTTKDNSIINAYLLEEYNLQYLKEHNDLITSVKKATEKQLLTPRVVVPKGTLPYDPKCDEACKFYCTKGNTQYPECLK